MAFPQSFLDELIARSDIVDVIGSYVQLQRKGANLFGLCPFHSEKTGSFSVSPDKQIYYCFGCKRGGGVVNFIMEEENLSFPDAVRFLAKRAGMEVPEEAGDREEGRRRQRLLDLNRDAARFYYQLLQLADNAFELNIVRCIQHGGLRNGAVHGAVFQRHMGAAVIGSGHTGVGP